MPPLQCLREYYATHIKEGDVKLRCPYPNCPTVVLPMQITTVVTDAALVQKYNQFAWFDQVKSNPNTRWCTKPGPHHPLSCVCGDACACTVVRVRVRW
jgi:hypothetical protein